MSRSSRSALLTLTVTLILAPFLTLHPAATHLYEAGLAGLSIELTHPQVVVFLALTGASALPAAGFLLALVAAARSQKELRALVEGSSAERLEGIEYRVIPSDRVLMFTAGLLRPVVFASSEAVRRLSRSELHAALLHERAHQRNRDVFWGLLLHAIGRACGFLPRTRRTVEMAALHAECAADEYAVRGGARRSDLLEAIAAAVPSATHFASTGIADVPIEIRLQHLVHPETPLPGRPTSGLLSLAAAMTVPAILTHVVAIAAAECVTYLAH